MYDNKCGVVSTKDGKPRIPSTFSLMHHAHRAQRTQRIDSGTHNSVRVGNRLKVLAAEVSVLGDSYIGGGSSVSVVW